MKTLVPKVRSFSEEHDLKLHGWPPDVGGNEFDLGVVASFGRLIPKSVIDAFPMSVAIKLVKKNFIFMFFFVYRGMINVHGSLLPRWRGASPLAHAILHGDRETGISIMEVAPHQ